MSGPDCGTCGKVMTLRFHLLLVVFKRRFQALYFSFRLLKFRAGNAGLRLLLKCLKLLSK